MITISGKAEEHGFVFCQIDKFRKFTLAKRYDGNGIYYSLTMIDILSILDEFNQEYPSSEFSKTGTWKVSSSLQEYRITMNQEDLLQFEMYFFS